jgi:catechol 2,3-dioxygenase-like lactoylglutathione lyase family enzyme
VTEAVIEDLDHVVLYAGDSERTIAFYRDVLGCEILGEAKWRTGASPVFQIKISASCFINVHPSGRELHPRAAEATPGSLDICFRTSLRPAAVARHFEQHGVAVEVGPVPRRNALGRGSVSHYVRDPDGNLVELMAVDDSG